MRETASRAEIALHIPALCIEASYLSCSSGVARGRQTHVGESGQQAAALDDALTPGDEIQPASPQP